MLNSLTTGNYTEPSKLTVGAFLQQWLKDYAATNVRPKTLDGYRIMLERRVIPRIGSVPLAQLHASHIQELYASLLKEGRTDTAGGLSARSVLHTHRVLNEALNHAVKWGVASRNVALAVDPPRAAHQEMHALDSDQVTEVLHTAENTVYYPVVHLAVHTGLRRSELLGLRWRDIDLEMATLSVVQGLHVLNDNTIVIAEPKSAKGRRMVSLTPISVLALQRHKRAQVELYSEMGTTLADDGLIFSHPDGRPFLPNTVTHAFAKIVRKAGHPGVRFQDLRHTHATILLKQGIHPPRSSRNDWGTPRSPSPSTPTRMCSQGSKRRQHFDSMKRSPTGVTKGITSRAAMRCGQNVIKREAA